MKLFHYINNVFEMLLLYFIVYVIDIGSIVAFIALFELPSSLLYKLVEKKKKKKNS